MSEQATKIKAMADAMKRIIQKHEAGKKLTSIEQDLIQNDPDRKVNRLPIYSSIQQCSNGTGIPIDVIKRCKNEGCTAFKAHRVSLEELLRYIHRDRDKELPLGENLNGTPRSELDVWRAKRERIKWQKDAEEILDKAETRSSLQTAMALMWGNMDRIFCSELPPNLVGKRELAIRKECQDAIDSLKTGLRERFEALTKDKESKSDE